MEAWDELAVHVDEEPAPPVGRRDPARAHLGPRAVAERVQACDGRAILDADDRASVRVRAGDLARAAAQEMRLGGGDGGDPARERIHEDHPIRGARSGP